MTTKQAIEELDRCIDNYRRMQQEMQQEMQRMTEHLNAVHAKLQEATVKLKK